MCNGQCMCGANDSNEPPIEEQELAEAYGNGYADGFSDARRVFWAELMIKSGDMKAMAGTLERSGDKLDADTMKVAEAAYFNAAEALLRSRRDFPGYVEKDFDTKDMWEESDASHSDFVSGEHSDCDCH